MTPGILATAILTGFQNGLPMMQESRTEFPSTSAQGAVDEGETELPQLNEEDAERIIVLEDEGTVLMP